MLNNKWIKCGLFPTIWLRSAQFAIELHIEPSLPPPPLLSRARRGGLWPRWGMSHEDQKSEGLLPEEGCVGRVRSGAYGKGCVVRTWSSSQQRQAQCVDLLPQAMSPGGALLQTAVQVQLQSGQGDGQGEAVPQSIPQSSGRKPVRQTRRVLLSHKAKDDWWFDVLDIDNVSVMALLELKAAMCMIWTLKTLETAPVFTVVSFATNKNMHHQNNLVVIITHK